MSDADVRFVRGLGALYHKAVILTDLSDDSDVLMHGMGRLRALGVDVGVLTHVTDVFADRVERDTEADRDMRFQEQIEMLENLGIDVHVDMSLGHPAFSLQEVSRRHGADLIVVGSHKSGLFGDTASHEISADLVQFSDTPVLLACNAALSADSSADRPLLDNVLYATDFSQTAERAFTHLAYAVRLGVGSITLLHVQDVDRIDDPAPDRLLEFDYCDEQRLERIKDRLAEFGSAEVECEIFHGSPAARVAALAASGQFTYVVLGSHGRSRTPEGLLGGVSDRVIRESCAPVMLIPSPKEPRFA